MDEQRKKIELPEIIIMLLLNGGADALDVVADLSLPVPIVGQIMLFLNVLSGVVVLAITQFWLIMKGGVALRKQVAYLTGALLDLMPVLNALPTKTVALIIAMYLINSAKQSEVEAASQATSAPQTAAVPEAATE